MDTQNFSLPHCESLGIIVVDDLLQAVAAVLKAHSRMANSLRFNCWILVASVRVLQRMSHGLAEHPRLEP